MKNTQTVLAYLHSQEVNGKRVKKDEVEILDSRTENGVTTYIVQTQDGKYCTAIFNPFTCSYYADDVYGVLKEAPMLKDNAARQTDFLDRSQADPMYAIYQLKDDGGLWGYAFTNYDTLKKSGKKVERNNYNLIYADAHNDESLDDIYTRFNIDHPKDFRGHSLSVSDVIVLKDDDGQYSAFYVDSIGFKPLRGFMSESGRTRKKSDMEM